MPDGAQTGLTIAQRARSTHLRIYRGVAWAGVVLQALEIEFQILTGNSHAPLALRYAVVAGLAAFLLASYTSQWAR